ncbi:hypothetical protein K0T92_09610 [Paenibacillus oenotherae]|uniref:Uncharacterized protein n=1 Tax=Paenibacillus oenotherae TaxID=1435645 RepID=A0ABS7D5A1_9BACL|nr:hypothetical protein [Paenibacillus oenotherae]MBW7475001.1 hypothetical protein [Paenibacillus oenotherae]
MIQILLGILGCYTLAAAAVHMCSLMALKRERDTRHYVLITGNEELQMEMYMRSLRRFSHGTGTAIRVTVLDHGCEDETMGIVRCFARRGMDVCIKPCESFSRSLRRLDYFARELGHRPGQGWSEGDCPPEKEGSCRTDKSQIIAGNGPRRTKAGRESLWAKWQRFRNAKPSPQEPMKDSKENKEVMRLLWLLQTEGIVTESDHAILVNLGDPADLSKLPL